MSNSILFSHSGSLLGFKIKDHETDPDKLVIKTKFADVLETVATALGVECEQLIEGRSYRIGVFARADFFANFGKLAEAVFVGNCFVLPSSPEATDDAIGPAVPYVDEDDDDEDDEDDDGEAFYNVESDSDDEALPF